jgi:hypothetical protein
MGRMVPQQVAENRLVGTAVIRFADWAEWGAVWCAERIVRRVQGSVI